MTALQLVGWAGLGVQLVCLFFHVTWARQARRNLKLAAETLNRVKDLANRPIGAVSTADEEIFFQVFETVEGVSVGCGHRHRTALAAMECRDSTWRPS